ncbi:MAG: AbrB/MazE/SpoVT family DNA-binding domain-containing protein [Desulfotomaculum sp.]|nr:AbrB/MazE/SpoVT family DNA-binding domain-containing protein [Desulfotomaculum sp.]
MKSQIRQWGNSLGVRIPEVLVEKVGFFDGVDVEFQLSNDNNIIISRKKTTLEKLMSQVTPENIHSEIDSGCSVGREKW